MDSLYFKIRIILLILHLQYFREVRELEMDLGFSSMMKLRSITLFSLCVQIIFHLLPIYKNGELLNFWILLIGLVY
jgi:hypothetical protein